MSKLLCVCMLIALATIVRAQIYDPGTTNFGCVDDSWYVMEKSQNHTALHGAHCFTVDYSYSNGILDQTSTMTNGINVRVKLIELHRINSSPVFFYQQIPATAVLYSFFTDDLCKYIVARRFNNDVTVTTPLGTEDVYYFLTKTIIYNQGEADVMKALYADGIDFYPVTQDGCDE